MFIITGKGKKGERQAKTEARGQEQEADGGKIFFISHISHLSSVIFHWRPSSIGNHPLSEMENEN
jgi:hypothetical protein